MEKEEFPFSYIPPVIDTVRYLTVYDGFDKVSSFLNLHLLVRILIFDIIIGCWDFSVS